VTDRILFDVFGSTLAYSIGIWLATGLVLLVMDAARLKHQNRRKEMKIARVAGWFNLTAGIVLLIVYLIY